MNLEVIYLGRTRYAEAWDLQKRLFDLSCRDLIGDMLLLTEHEHVYTLGKGGNEDHLLATEHELIEDGTDVFRIDRGGDITYHGPGQLVGYPILNLNRHTPDIHRYLRTLEEVIITALSEFGIAGKREGGMTGVWVGGEKIAAIGVKVSKWVTMHGFALNVSTDLQKFARIIPCGIFHKGVTSMQKVLGREIAFDEVNRVVAGSFAGIFGCKQLIVSPETLLERLKTLESHPMPNMYREKR